MYRSIGVSFRWGLSNHPLPDGAGGTHLRHSRRLCRCPQTPSPYDAYALLAAMLRGSRSRRSRVGEVRVEAYDARQPRARVAEPRDHLARARADRLPASVAV